MSRTFGIEIEFIGNRAAVSRALNDQGVTCAVQGYNHRTISTWKVVSDASLRGGETGELVSPPMQYNDASFAIIEKVCAALETAGATVERQCGLHVHHDAGDFRGPDFARLVADYTDNRDIIDTFMPSSRSRSNGGWATSPTQRIRGLANATAVRRACHGRYTAVNVSAFFVHGTVEFRQHAGTIDAEKIISWVHFTHAFMEKARAGDDLNSCDDLHDLLEKLSHVSPTQEVRVRLSVVGIGGLAYRLIEQGLDNDEILQMVLRANPDASTTVGCIKWYRSKYNKLQRQNGSGIETRQARQILSNTTRSFFIARRDHFANSVSARRVA